MNNLTLFAHLLYRVLLLTGLGPAIAIAILAEFPYVYRWSPAAML